MKLAKPVVSFDMDGTLVSPEYTDWVWHHGIPMLYAEKIGCPFEQARAFVVKEYGKVGESALEWYDIQYWLRFFGLETDWRILLGRYADKVSVYPDVYHLLDRLKGEFKLILASNAGREFIDVEMEVTGLCRYFDEIFSATSDFRVVKKTSFFYKHVCAVLGIHPEQMIHVGDHYEFDYLVPRAVGVQAFYLNRSASQDGEFILRDLRELEKWLCLSVLKRADVVLDP